MKVLLLTGEFPPMQGGVGDYTASLAAALEQRGVSCSIVTGAGRGVRPAHNVCPEMPGWGFRDWSILSGLIGRLRPDIVHVQYQTAAYGMHPLINALPLLSRLSRPRIPVVTTFHDMRVPYLFPKAGPLRGLANWLLAAVSQACVATNDEDMERLRKMWRQERRRGDIVLIPIGSNISVSPPDGYSRDELRTRFGLAQGEAIVSYFGLVNETKGVETLFHAIAGFPTDCPVHVVMIGGTEGHSDVTNAQYRRQMLDLCRHLALDDRVTWTGF